MSELKFATITAEAWSSACATNLKKWFYYGSGKPIGPMNWKEIEQVKDKYPDMFLSFEETGNSEKIKFWLPAKVIDKIQVLIK